MSEIYRIGMAELRAINSPDIITTLGLGSCVGITIYDPILKVGGMAHIMLPYAVEIRDNINFAKFADTGIPRLVDEVKKLGGNQIRLVAKIAGGAQMFAVSQTNDIMRVGYRNVISVKETLEKLRIPLLAEDTGGNVGRTIEFYTETGKLLVKTIGLGIKEI